MRKILILALCLVSFASFGQVYQPYSQYGGKWKRIIVDSVFNIPRYTDTTQANLHIGFDSCGAMFFSYLKDSIYYRACNPKRWISVGSGSGGGGGSGIDSLYADTTFLKTSSYTADQKRGNVLGIIFEGSDFANLDDFTVGAGSTPSVSGGKITDTVGSASCLTCYVGLDPTMLERWTITAGFTVDDKTGTSYGVQIGTASTNTVYKQNIRGFINLRSSGIYEGRLDLVDGEFVNNTLVSSASNISFSVGDSIVITLTRNVNIFTFIARNVSTGAAEVSVSYTYTGSTAAANTGRPVFVWRGGKQSLYSFKFSSDESIETQLVNIGDSKMTWYGNYVTQRIPNMMYQYYGNVVSQSGSGNMTAEAVATLDETILLSPEKVLVTVGSNDIRNGISSGTWQANIDTIYNKLTRNGIEVFFSLMYETNVDQSALITYLLLNYTDKTILDGYYATQDCNSCLQADDIHLTAYGNRKWLEATAESGVIDFFNHFREMKFTAGDALTTAVGDSIAINRYFATSNKLNVFREGELQWIVSSYEPASVERVEDTIKFHPPLSTGERIVIQASPQVKWATILPQEPYLLTDFPSSARGYSFRRLNEAYNGTCIRIRRSSDNAESNIAFINNFLDTASMKTFVGSSSAYVTTWYDQSGFGENATNTTSANQPRIMNAGVIDRVQNNDGDWVVSLYFDGSNDVLQYTGVQNNSVDWYLFQVCKRVSTSSIGSFIGSTGGGSQIFYYSNDFLYIIRSTGGSLGYKNVSDATTTFNLLSGGYPEYLLYKNGSSVSLSSESFLGASGAPTEFNALGIAGASFSNCYISEAIIYPNDQSANRTGIDLNINNFWKIY